jgi:hypothetical protein
MRYKFATMMLLDWKGEVSHIVNTVILIVELTSVIVVADRVCTRSGASLIGFPIRALTSVLRAW